jgi:hypothetical protein
MYFDAVVGEGCCSLRDTQLRILHLQGSQDGKRYSRALDPVLQQAVTITTRIDAMHTDYSFQCHMLVWDDGIWVLRVFAFYKVRYGTKVQSFGDSDLVPLVIECALNFSMHGAKIPSLL